MKTIDGLPLRDAILRMAIPTFVELGFDKASMDEVAARAATTKRTVYAHFGSKEDLFRESLVLAVELFLSELPELSDAEDPARELETFFVRFTELSTWRGAVRLQRVAMAEAERFPDIGKMLHREVIEQTQLRVTNYLGKLPNLAIPSGCEADDNVLSDLATMLLNMTTGPQRFATLFGAVTPPTDHPNAVTPLDLDRARIRRAIDLFMAGTGLRTL